MSISSYSAAARPAFVLAALLGTTMLAAPLTAAWAETAAPKAGMAATMARGETVEQRITSLRAALKITPDQETKWDAVAQSMRENAAAMDKLVAEGRTAAPGSLSAVDDLKMYAKFSQAHVDGLKNLTTSFTTLYAAMPDAQKKVADGVFETAHRPGAAHG